jgi:WD40 repeat protein
MNPEKIKLLQEYKHARPLTSCYWDPGDRLLFFGAEDNLVHRYSLGDKTVTALEAHDSWVRAIGVSQTEDWLLTGGYDGRLVWWKASSADSPAVRTVEAHQGWIRALAISPDQAMLATCGNDRWLRVWDVAEGKLIRELQTEGGHLYHVAFSLDGNSLVSCDLQGVVRVWEWKDTTPIKQVMKVEPLYKYAETFRAEIGGARSLAFDDHGLVLGLGGITNVTNAFAGLGEMAVALLDWKSGKLLQLLEAKDKLRGAAWGLAFHPDNYWIGVSGGGGGGWLYFWKGDDKHEFFKFKLKSDGRGMSISPDRRRLAVAHADGYLRIYGDES